RDIERIAPLFVEAGLIRSVDRPKPLDVNAAGISTRVAVKRAAGGFLYAAAGSRVDLVVEDNVVATRDEDSVCEIDDIDYEDQSKRFQLIGMRQAYELADRALSSREPYDLVLMDCPLLLNRSIAPIRAHVSHAKEFRRTVETIGAFWETHRENLYPWDPRGPVVAGLAAERFGAIVYVSQQDLRTEEGRKHVLHLDDLAPEPLMRLLGSQDTIAGVGERRFISGILGSYTRTSGIRMNTQTPRMEPESVVNDGVIGLHYCAGPGTAPRLLQLVGDEPEWTVGDFDDLVGQLMALTIVGGQRAWPLPIQLAAQELAALPVFIEHYRAGVHTEMKQRNIEDVWLSEMDELL
ncbi:MAG: hypothetical protein OEU26_21680, partial [Candidatus Tectomicrobia bacterium]|nr:hypothetical protein [Candidatus Tectomicrobia bacterium]